MNRTFLESGFVITIQYESMDLQNKSMFLQISYTIPASLVFSQSILAICGHSCMRQAVSRTHLIMTYTERSYLLKILLTYLIITLKVCLPKMVERNLDNAVRKQSRRPSSPDDLPEGRKSFDF
jgi:hypothetical protein